MGLMDKAKIAQNPPSEPVSESPQKVEPQPQINLTQKRVIEDKDNSLDTLKDSIRNELLQLQSGAEVVTKIDDIFTLIKERNKISISGIATQLNIPKKYVETIVSFLEESSLVSITYPIIFLQSPYVTFKSDTKNTVSEEIVDPNKKLLEKYVVMSDYVVADVHVWSVPMESTPIYQIVPHELGVATSAVLKQLVDELAEQIPVFSNEISDPKKALEFKLLVFEKAKKIVEKYIHYEQESIRHMLSGVLLHQSFGLGDLEVLMADNWLEEVAINGHNEPVSVYQKRYGWLKTTTKFSESAQIYNLAAQIARRAGKQINSLTPIMDAHLSTGDRVAATLFPVSTDGDTITIRRFSRNPWTVVHMIDEKNHTMSKEIVAFLWLAIQYELNMLIVGGTASGKTSVLNTLASLIPPTNRVISIEDTREISLPEPLHWNWVPLSSKSANAEGQGEVSMLDLMVASLRMRPDRIIVGEIRRKQQAEAMFEAMHTGHSVMATMHADTSEQVKHRLTQPPIDIPENELEALQLIAVQYRDRRKGARRTLEVAELLPGGGTGDKINLNYLYRWRARGDKFVKDESSIRVVEDLNLHTGMTHKDIDNDLHDKIDILDWLVNSKIYDIDKLGHIMRIYYKYPELLFDTIKDKGGFTNLPTQ